MIAVGLLLFSVGADACESASRIRKKLWRRGIRNRCYAAGEVALRAGKLDEAEREFPAGSGDEP